MSIQKLDLTDHKLLEILQQNAKIAQLVERDLAKVEVAGSSPVFRSKTIQRSDGEIGRHAGLKIQ